MRAGSKHSRGAGAHNGRMSEFQLRPAGLDDLDAILRHVQAGFDSYADFAPVGWRPPQVSADRELTASLLAEEETWAALAIHEASPIGHVAFFPGRQRARTDAPADWRTRPRIPGLAHLWQLFVLPPWWGRGVAAALHVAAVAQMRERGFDRARLYTPAAHARARAFYERRGWVAHNDAYHAGLKLVLTEYRLTLP